MGDKAVGYFSADVDVVLGRQNMKIYLYKEFQQFLVTSRTNMIIFKDKNVVLVIFYKTITNKYNIGFGMPRIMFD